MRVVVTTKQPTKKRPLRKAQQMVAQAPLIPLQILLIPLQIPRRRRTKPVRLAIAHRLALRTRAVTERARAAVVNKPVPRVGLVTLLVLEGIANKLAVQTLRVVSSLVQLEIAPKSVTVCVSV